MKANWTILGALALAAAAPVSAALISFNFNAPVQTGAPGWNPGVNTDGLNGANTTGLGSYMNSVLTGSTVSGALATRNYSADGHVIAADPTLGTSDGATGLTDNSHGSTPPDGFLMNNNLPGLGSSNSIVISIPAGVPLGTVSFDWEIFPDNNCSSGGCLNNPSDPNFPTLTFDVGATQEGKFSALTSAALGGGADPQNIGTASFALNLPATASPHTLTFLDWPPEIGIDNLTIQTCASTDRACLSKQSIPEPSPLPLTVLALALVRWQLGRGAARPR